MTERVTERYIPSILLLTNFLNEITSNTGVLYVIELSNLSSSFLILSQEFGSRNEAEQLKNNKANMGKSLFINWLQFFF